MIKLRNDCLWRIEKSDSNWLAVNIKNEQIMIENQDMLNHGDVVEISQDGEIHLIHNGSSPNALIYVTNQCNSNCIMCPDSVKVRTKENTITFSYLMEYISLLPSDLLHVDITGGEPTLLKYQLPVLIEKIFEQAENVEILMLSNGRSFADYAYTASLIPFSKKQFKIEIPIHSANPQTHDLIAGCSGSFLQTMQGISQLLKIGIEVGIRIVVSKMNYEELDDIIQLICNEFPKIRYVNFMGMEVLGNAWKNRDCVWIELDELKPYIQHAIEKSFSLGIQPILYNFPLCLFDKKYWYCYRNSITGYKIRYFEQCDLCSEKQKCGGFFFSTFYHTKYKVKIL